MSKLFEWDVAKLGLGIPKMDQDHQKMITLMNKLYCENLASATKESLLRLAAELQKVTTQHFSDEEKYFGSIKSYKFGAAHKLTHQTLTSSLNDHITKFLMSSDQKLSDEFFRFLKFWWSSHIGGIDKKYADAAKQEK